MQRRKPRKPYRNRNRQWDTRQNTFAFTLKTTAVIVSFIFRASRLFMFAPFQSICCLCF